MKIYIYNMIRTLPSILLFFLPVALGVNFMRVMLITLSQHESNLRLPFYWMGDAISVILVLCIWKGVQRVYNSTQVYVEKDIRPSSILWLLLLIWSFLLTFILTIIYEILFVASFSMTTYGFATFSKFSSILSAYWPNPSEVGWMLFLSSIIFIEPVATIFFLCAALYSYWRVIPWSSKSK